MLTTLLAEAAQKSTGLNLKGFVIVAIVFILVYPLQKRLRHWVSKRRLERWHEEDTRHDRDDQEHRRDDDER